MDDTETQEDSRFNGFAPSAGLQNSLATEESFDMDSDLLDFESWSSKRTRILRHFTTNEKLTITTSFLPSGIPLDAHISVVDRAAHR
jgi:hypothetical protein